MGLFAFSIDAAILYFKKRKREKIEQAIAEHQQQEITHPAQVTSDIIRKWLVEHNCVAIPFGVPTPEFDEYDEEGVPHLRCPQQKQIPWGFIEGKLMMTEDSTTRH